MKQTDKMLRYTLCFDVPADSVWDSDIENALETLRENVGANIVDVEVIGPKVHTKTKKKVIRKKWLHQNQKKKKRKSNETH